MKKLLSLVLALTMVLCMAAPAVTAEEEIPVIEMFYSPWGSTPHEGYDPYEEYAEALCNCDFVLNPSADFNTEVLIRFASDDHPDFMTLGTSMLNTLYDQGVLIDDWMPYEEVMPTFFSRIEPTTRQYYDVDGKLIVLPSKAEASPAAFMVRQDWLNNLGMSMPTSLEEYLEVMKAFTFNDPDGNGKDDTWGFSTDGAGVGTSDLRAFINFWSPTSWHIDEATGEVTHPVLNGAFLKYLQFAKQMIDAGVMYPDWFTQGGTEEKIPVFSQQVVGSVYHTSWHLIDESDSAHNRDGSIVGVWEPMPMFSGKLPVMRGLASQLRTVSAQCAEDPAKMAAITTLIEKATWPNEAYGPLMQGVGIDAVDVVEELGDGYVFWGYSSPEQYQKRLRLEGSIMWAFCQFVHNEGFYYISADNKVSDVTKYLVDVNSKIFEIPTWGGESILFNPDPTVQEDANTLLTQFELSYLMGDVTDADWDAFVETWMANGGQELMDTAIADFTEFGVL